jgi:hypothetical protein
MQHTLRRTALACLLAALLAAAGAAPALAAPRAPAGLTARGPSLALLDRLAAWLGGWFGEPGGGLIDPDGTSGLRSLTAAGGGQIDPNGTSDNATSPALGAPGTVTTEGGALIDPSR